MLSRSTLKPAEKESGRRPIAGTTSSATATDATKRLNQGGRGAAEMVRKTRVETMRGLHPWQTEGKSAGNRKGWRGVTGMLAAGEGGEAERTVGLAVLIVVAYQRVPGVKS